MRRCVGDADEFLRDAWGRRAHLHRGAGADDLLSLQAVDQLLTSTALRTPAFRLVKGGQTLPASRFTRGGRIGSRQINDLIDPAGVMAEFNDGATIVLQGLHRFWPPVTALCRQLESELTHPVQANAYLTPPGSQGLNVHADGHDVFAIQCAGRKEWVLHADGADAPATQRLTLARGDSLYVPKGMAHAARTVEEASLHLTIGIRRLTWADAVRPAVSAALDDASLDTPLPPGFAHDPARLSTELADRLRAVAAAIEKGDGSALAESVARRFWSTRLVSLEGQLLQLLTLDGIDDDTRLTRRAHTHASLQRDHDRIVLVMTDRRVRFPATVEPVLHVVLAADRLRLGELAGYLDARSRVVLARRLVREGLLIAEPPAAARGASPPDG